MKKLIAVFLILLAWCTLVVAETGRITETCALRDTGVFKQSRAIGTVAKGTEVEILSSFADYGLGKATDARTGKTYKGYAWQGVLSQVSNNIYVVTGQGMRLTKQPKKGDDSNVVARIWPGSQVEITKWLTTYYEITGPFGRGWVYKAYLKINKEAGK